MTMKTFVRAIVVGCCLIAVGFASDGLFEGVLTPEAQAIVGRPMTPGSVAGVARRTTRRTIRRTAVMVAALPRGCRTTAVISGATLYHCKGVYYQPQGNQYVIVNVE